MTTRPPLADPFRMPLPAPADLTGRAACGWLAADLSLQRGESPRPAPRGVTSWRIGWDRRMQAAS